MWYPTLPDVMYLHERICEVQDVPAQIREMSAVDEAILAPQRTGVEERSRAAVARKTAALLRPLVKSTPFSNCSDRIAFAVAQQFAGRNGYVVQLAFPEARRTFDQVRDGDPGLDSFAAWLESHLATRFDASHRARIFSSLNQLAQVKHDIERMPGLQEEVDQIDAVGYTLAQQAAALFRLDEEAITELRDRFPVFWEAWNAALPQKQ